jgi:galactitol-specific phosphotransferase system IIC component
MDFAWVLEFLGWVFEKLFKYQLIVGPIVVGFIAALLIAIATKSKAGSALAGIVAMAITFLSLIIIG